jgi:hypothetical protein
VRPGDLAVRLASPNGAGELLGLLFDHLMETPLDRFVTADQVADRLRHALSSDRLAGLIREEITSLQASQPGACQRRGERVEAYVPAPAFSELDAILARPVVIDPRWVRAALGAPALRLVLRRVVEEAVTAVVAALRPGSGSGGLLGGLGPLGFPGSGALLGRLAAQIEAQLQRAAGALVEPILDRVIHQLTALASRPDTPQNLARALQHGLRLAMGIPTADLWDLGRALPAADLAALLPAVLVYNLGRTELRQDLEREARTFLQREGTRRLGSFLGEAARGAYRAEVLALGGPWLAEAMNSDRVCRWLAGDRE